MILTFYDLIKMYWTFTDFIQINTFHSPFSIPVADGKKMPTSSVNDVAMSADTYMENVSMLQWESTDCSPAFSKISPFGM